MLTDPEERRTPVHGTAELVVVFRIDVGPEDDAPDLETARLLVRDQLRDALTAAATCRGLSRTHREVLSGWEEVEVLGVEEDE
jgi:hypothetical protein